MIRRPPRSTRTTHSFPTRRSSDLNACWRCRLHTSDRRSASLRASTRNKPFRAHSQLPPAFRNQRSEEHTSELQSLMRISYAVFCLKKKKNTKNPLKNKVSPLKYMNINERPHIQ